MKKRIKIKFAGFWPEFDEENNFIINPLKKYCEVILSEKPQYLFSSCFSDDYLDFDCVRIFYTGENLCPDFNAFDYAIGYEYMEYGDRYLRYPNYMIPEIYGSDFKRMQEKHLDAAESLKKKTDFCSFVVSKGNGYVAKEREQFFYDLSKYRKVNSGGRFLNNIGEKAGVRDKLAFQARHKFAIAFENSTHSGYSTEKIVQAFAAKTVPIYWGDPRISEVFCESAFINCHKFSGFDEVIEEVKRVDRDEELYLSMLSSPALNEPDAGLACSDALEKFLLHIVGPDIAGAYRRDLAGYNLAHVDRLRKMRHMEKSIWGKFARLTGVYK